MEERNAITDLYVLFSTPTGDLFWILFYWETEEEEKEEEEIQFQK